MAVLAPVRSPLRCSVCTFFSMAAPGVHLRQPRQARGLAAGNQQGGPANEGRLPMVLPLGEVEARYRAALEIPFPVELARTTAPHTWQFCERAGRALSSNPGNILLALIQMAGFEMPKVVAAYTALLDVPGLQWNLPLDRTGGGKSLVVTFIKETEKLRQQQLQTFYNDKYGRELADWVSARANSPHTAGPKPVEPKVKNVCDAGSLVAWAHTMSAPENESRGYVTECT